MPSLLYLALSNAVLATLLAAIGAVATRVCRRPSVRHALWLLVLLKLITPPMMPLSVSWPRSEEAEPLLTETPPSAVILPESLEVTASDWRQPADEMPQRPADAGRSPYSFAEVWVTILIVIWLCGALAWWTVAALRLRKFRRLLWQARAATADVQEQGRRLAALLRLRRCPPIVFVSAPLSPMLWALGFSPLLLVPAELWRKLTAEQQDTLLVHELAHLRRGDHWVRRLEVLVLGLYWWHPVVWWTRRRLQEAEEECCDALVVSLLPDAAPAYASALVETVAFLSQTRPAALIGVSGVGHVPLLKRRLTMILTETSCRKPSRIGFWMVLAMGALLLPLAPRAARTETPEKNERIEAADSVEEKRDTPKAQAMAKTAMAKILHTANCASCHQSPVSPPGLEHPWKELHNELLHLMEEHTRELRGIDRRPPPTEDRRRTEEIEKLQDEIELLKIQVRIKEAHAGATKRTLEEYRKRLKNVESAYNQGAVPLDTLEQVRLAVTTHEPQFQIHEAELQEALVRLKQAERRLARLQRPAEKTDAGGRAQQEKRLQDLEQKVENLLKEIRNLRREMRPDKPRDRGSAPDGLKR